MKKFNLILFLLFNLIFVTGSAQASEIKPIQVVASFTILGDVVKNVGGNLISVTTFVSPNGDPHDYQPSPKDGIAVKNAAALFISGNGLETWFKRIVKASGTKVPVTLVSKGIKTQLFERDGKQVTDPHVWNSVPNVIHWVGNIEKALSKADPANTAQYKINAEKYIEQLTTLNNKIHAEMNKVPASQRKVLTSHDAFGYYGKEYGVNFFAPLGLSTETEATALDVAKLIQQVKQEQIKVYFFENSNNARLVKQIANATGAKLGGELYPEALSKASGPAPTYIKMMEYNTEQLLNSFK